MFVLVVDFVYLSVVEKKFYDMYVVFVFLVHDILGYMVQIYLVANNHHLRISNPIDEMHVSYFHFVERMGNFHYDPVEDVNLFENLLNWLVPLNYPNIEILCYYYDFFVGDSLFLMDVCNYHCVLQKIVPCERSACF